MSSLVGEFHRICPNIPQLVVGVRLFFDDDFVVKVPVHEMSPHAVFVLDSH
jgi:hypothetical protein